MANQNRLTPANIRYLVAMNLKTYPDGVRCVDLADALNVSRPSVHNMLDLFADMGIVTRRGKVAYLTEYGHELSQKYSTYYSTVSKVLSDIFPKIDNLNAAACQIISFIPEEELDKMCR